MRLLIIFFFLLIITSVEAKPIRYSCQINQDMSIDFIIDREKKILSHWEHILKIFNF